MEVEVDVFELRDYAHDITNNLLTGFAPPALESMLNTVVSADALIAVTPIFSTSYSGLFKSFIDVIDPDALTGKPVLIGANAGTPRHSLAIDYAIRPLFAYLHAEPDLDRVSSRHRATGADRAIRSPRSVSGSSAPRPSSPRRSHAARPRHPSTRSTRRATSVRVARSGTCSAASRGSSAQPSTMSDGASNGFQAAGRAVGVSRTSAVDEGTEVDPRELLDVDDRHLEGAEGAERGDGTLGRVDELGLIEDEPRRGELRRAPATTRRPSRTGEGPGCRGTAGRRARGPAR